MDKSKEDQSVTKQKKRGAEPAGERVGRISIASLEKKKKSSAPVSQPTILPFLRSGVRQVVAKDFMKAALSVNLEGDWPTLSECIPPASLLDEIQALFLQTTDIPLELPVFGAMHYLSALLLQRGVKIAFAGDEIRPDVWTICLAASGDGKTYAQTQIAHIFGGDVRLFNDFASSAKFVEELRDNNHGLWLRDEFAQFLAAVEQQPHLHEAKDYLLRCYDGQPISRRTKSDEITVEEPALTIFGSTVLDTFKHKITEEMLLDGFAQRFSYVVANRDESRTQAIYHTRKHSHQVKATWNTIRNAGFLPLYEVDEDAEHSFEQAFHLLLAKANAHSIPRSFLRRIAFRGVKYALIYHVLLGKTGKRLDEQDFGYAARVCAMNLRDLRKVLDQFNMSAFQDLLNKAHDFVRRKQAEKVKVTPSVLLAGVRGIGKADKAREVLDALLELHPGLAGSIEMGKPQKRAHLHVVGGTPGGA